MCAQLGWRVMPLHPDTKRPAIKKWPERATTDLGEIQGWWLGSFAGHNVGILTGPESGIWVLDIDVKWCNGFASVRDLFAQHGQTQVPNTFRVGTPSGGQQWYFAYPADGRKIGNVASAPGKPGPLGDGLDVRGWHGQVVAPGSLDRPVINDAPVADAPSWLVDLVTVRDHIMREPLSPSITAVVAERITREIADKLALRPNGGRNDALNCAAFQLGLLGTHGVLSREVAEHALREACEHNGLISDDGEASFAATFASGWESGFRAEEKQ